MCGHFFFVEKKMEHKYVIVQLNREFLYIYKKFESWKFWKIVQDTKVIWKD